MPRLEEVDSPLKIALLDLTCSVSTTAELLTLSLHLSFPVPDGPASFLLDPLLLVFDVVFVLNLKLVLFLFSEFFFSEELRSDLVFKLLADLLYTERDGLVVIVDATGSCFLLGLGGAFAA